MTRAFAQRPQLPPRAIDDPQHLDGARRSTLEELTDWMLWADNVITF
jgi:uncharacterized protein involved in oxidation of intracellular sulfur